MLETQIAETEKAAETVPCIRVLLNDGFRGKDEWERLQAAYGPAPTTYAPNPGRQFKGQILMFRDISEAQPPCYCRCLR
jgi:hypothetical protein